MTNVIVDAGTDAKIAKFQKRGIELIDLALLEPVEVWGEGGREKDAKRESMKIVADEMGASVVVGWRGSGVLSSKTLTTFLQPGGSRPVTPAASSATSLHSQIALPNDNSSIPASIPSHLSSQNAATQYSTPPRSNIPPPAAAISHSNSSSSNDPTPVPSASPASSLATMSPPPSPAPGKRNLFNKLFNKKQSSSNLLSPSGSGSPGFSRQQIPQQHPLARYNQPYSEGSPPPTFASFAMSPAPVTNKIIDGGPDTAATMGRSFGSRSNSTKRRSAPPPLVEAPLFSPSELTSIASPVLGNISDLTPPIEQTTPTQKSVAAGSKMVITVSSPMVEAPKEREREREKGHGRNISLTSITSPFRSTLKSRLSSVVMGGGSQSNPVDNIPPSPNKTRREGDRDASPRTSMGSNRKSRSRSSLVGTMSTNESSDSGFIANANWSFGGNGQAPQQVAMTQAQGQSEITMNLRQQQLQLRPPVLGIQPTFVSSNSSSASSNNPLNPFFPDAPTTTTTENPDQLIGQRALMYVWLVRKWMKKKPSGLATLTGLGDSAVGFLGGVVGLKDKEKGKEKEKDRDKSRGNSGEYRDKSHDGVGAVTAPLMYGGVEVRFEWKRARIKEKSGSRKKTRNGRGRARTMGTESDGEVETSIRDRIRERNDRGERGSSKGPGGGGGGPAMMHKTQGHLKSEEKRKNRMSTGSLSSVVCNSEMDGGELRMKKKSSNIANNQDEEDEDSDPEDSETPWVCTLKLRRGATSESNPAAGDAQTSQPPALQTQVLRIKVGTLSPMPHHPKVVAMLKVPFPLPDVEVDRMGVVKRQITSILGGVLAPNSNANQDSSYNGLVLTAEEIKDAVCSTGLWLVVREGFGGVGKVSRKGDGWRIRP